MYYYTTDWHLGHENVIKFDKRPYRSVFEMEEDIFHKVNEVVQPKDVLIYGGDFMMPKLKSRHIEEYNQVFLDYVQRINCKNIIWIGGNHDRFHDKVHGEYIPNFALTDHLRWQVLCPRCQTVRSVHARQACHVCRKVAVSSPPRMLEAVHPMGYELRLTAKLCSEQGLSEKFIGMHVVFSHYSMRVWNKSHKVNKDGSGRSVMLYGHSHGGLPGFRNTFDCGWNSWYRPLPLEEILDALIPEHNKYNTETFDHHSDQEERYGLDHRST